MFIPHTDAERQAMLEAIGIERLEDLFTDVPEAHKYPTLHLPPRMTEMEILTELQGVQEANETVNDLTSFLGAGAYNHFIPSAVDAIISRGEFLTAYTPYQPEVSQGTLQAIFEYQSLITSLTGMYASNASHYDGATAVAEAVNLAYHQFRGKRHKVVLSSGLHPHYWETVYTYTHGSDVHVVDDEAHLGLNESPADLIPLIDKDTCLVMVQYPDFFGRIHDFTALAEAAHQAGALFGVSVNPTALALLRPPSEFGADIVTGEGQPLGIPLAYGGPYLGIFATTKKYVRKIAGRLVGETVDTRGQRAYVLTLAAREQHIRRDRATSNICTNQGLMALAATVYTSLLGKHGMRQVAELCYHKAHYAASRIAELPGFELASDQPFFHEFAVRCPKPAKEINESLLQYDILGGYGLGQDFPELADHLLIAVTEMNTRLEIDALVEALREVTHD